MTTNTTTKRRCAGNTCLTLLNQYNAGDYCHQCLARQTDARIKQWREKFESDEAKRLSDDTDEPRLYGRALGIYDREGLLVTLKEMEEYFGRTPKRKECGGRWPNEETFCKHFGSWVAALRAAGMSRAPTLRERVMEELRSGPKTTKELQVATGKDQRYIHRMVADLRVDGKVVSVPNGRQKIHRLVKSGAA